MGQIANKIKTFTSWSNIKKCVYSETILGPRSRCSKYLVRKKEYLFEEMLVNR